MDEKKKKIEVFHMFGISSMSRMSDNLIYKIMDNVTFKQIKKSILLDIEECENILNRNPQYSELLSGAIKRNKTILAELIDHFEWIEK